MRIIAGRFRGTALAVLGKGDAGAHLRPTSDRVRESLFSMLTHRNVIQGARVLDLFAGTGALGLEALSRGARDVCFVENGSTGQRLITQNIEKLRVADEATLMRKDATRLGAWPHTPFDLVFLDPPYGKQLLETSITALAAAGWIDGSTLIIAERDPRDPEITLDGFELCDSRKYGKCQIDIGRFSA